MPLTSRCSRQAKVKVPEQTGGPLPRLFRSIAFLSLPPVSKTPPPNPESYFPTLRKGGMPTHRKASVAQSHPGRKPGREAVGHLLVKEETYHGHPGPDPHWALSPTCTLPTLLQTAVQTPLQGWLCPGLTRPLAAEVAGENWSPGWESTGPLPVWSHLCAFISSVRTETGPFSLPSCALGIGMLAGVGKAEAVDAVSFQIQLEALGQHPMSCLPLGTRLASLEPAAVPPGLLLLRERLRECPTLPLKSAVKKTFPLPSPTPTICYENIPVYE